MNMELYVDNHRTCTVYIKRKVIRQRLNIAESHRRESYSNTYGRRKNKCRLHDMFQNAGDSSIFLFKEKVT
jgi:hypothetical protein